MNFTSPLQLAETEPVANGQSRIVFWHPHDPTLLVKVIRPDVIEKRSGTRVPWYKKYRRFRHYISFIRETEEYIAGYTQSEGSVPFAQKIIGFVDTDLGLGLVMEAALDSEGKLAPTLARLMRRNQWTDEIRVELEHFTKLLIDSNLIVADLHPANLVRAYTPEKGHRIVLIDGLGLSTLFPMKLLSPAYNRLNKRFQIRALWTRLEEIRTGARVARPNPCPLESYRKKNRSVTGANDKDQNEPPSR